MSREFFIQRPLRVYSTFLIITMKPAMDVISPVGDWHIDKEETELELKVAHRSIIKNESRLELMRSLLEQGLCTRYIYAFSV